MGYWQDIRRNWTVHRWVARTNGLVLAGTFGYLLILRSFPGQAALAYFTLFWLAVNIAQLHREISNERLLAAEGVRYADIGAQSGTAALAVVAVISFGFVLGARQVLLPTPLTTSVLIFGAIAETLAWPYVWARILPYGALTSSLFFAAAHPGTVATWLATGAITPDSVVFFAVAVVFNVFMIVVIGLRDVVEGPSRRLFGFFAAAGIHFAVNLAIIVAFYGGAPESYSVVFGVLGV